MRAELAEVVPEEWPDDPLGLVAVDVQTGRRVVLRKRGSTGATLQQSVLASCAIPGIVPPVKVGRRVLVDGGAHSSTHLDLSATWGCDLIVGVVPMAFDPAAPRECVACSTVAAASSLHGRILAHDRPLIPAVSVLHTRRPPTSGARPERP